jgi:release factor glutamine methyltransferase
MTPSPLRGLTVAAARRTMAAALRERGIESPELDARILLGNALALDLTGLAAAADRALSERETETAWEAVRRRSSGEPVARILGRKEFWGLDLHLSPATLVPRPDTETVVEAAIALCGTERSQAPTAICDFGTGSGAILLALLSEYPHARGVGTDISEAALQTARFNAAAHRLADRARFVCCDYGAALGFGFDLVVSNPPYIRSSEMAALAREVRDFDPSVALDGGADGLEAYRALANDAFRILTPSGRLIVELGQGQGEAVAAILVAQGFRLCGEPRRDLSGIPRAMAATKP